MIVMTGVATRKGKMIDTIATAMMTVITATGTKKIVEAGRVFLLAHKQDKSKE